MTVVKIVNGRLKYTKDELDEIIRDCCHTGFYITGFKDKEEAECFISRFPKYVNLHVGKMVDINNNQSEICVMFRIESINRRTGLINETGDRRIRSLVKHLATLFGR